MAALVTISLDGLVSVPITTLRGPQKVPKADAKDVISWGVNDSPTIPRTPERPILSVVSLSILNLVSSRLVRPDPWPPCTGGQLFSLPGLLRSLVTRVQYSKRAHAATRLPR